jgi:hypothetical protein
MKRTLKIISCFAALILISPDISSGGQFKITRVYDGNTVKAEGYDEQCLG